MRPVLCFDPRPERHGELEAALNGPGPVHCFAKGLRMGRAARRGLLPRAFVVATCAPGHDGLEVLGELRRAHPLVPALAVVECPACDAINDAFWHDARCVIDTGDRDALRDALLDFLRKADGPALGMEAAIEAFARLHGLRGRQKEILKLTAAGCGRESLPERMGIRENTVKSHVRAILQKTDAPHTDALCRRVLSFLLNGETEAPPAATSG